MPSASAACLNSEGFQEDTTSTGAGSPSGAAVKKNPPPMQETPVRSPGREDLLKKEMQATPIFLPGKISWTEKPGSNSPWGQKRVRNNRAQHTAHFPDQRLDKCPLQ
ncbi:unnamed protein product [Rangifer tarandus platyrhynchus]|uniref:Uncharacterized protein n=2 Tax=Rangifer tarandus platyrhynchus TaxID=3082113 RepID=A0ABN8Y4G8_RANTA|nr:unnamed protein product [Rangifer tarandus platyrhynchus]